MSDWQVGMIGKGRQSHRHFCIDTKSAGIALIVWLTGFPGIRAQQYLTTFGSVIEFKVPRSTTSGLITGDFEGEGLSDIAAYGDSEIRFFLRDSTSAYRPGILVIERPIVCAVAARCNADRFSDIVVLTHDPPSIQVYLGKTGGNFQMAWERPIEEPAEHMIVADINGDRKQDILIYGKKSLGVRVFLGNGNGTFRSPSTILADYSLSDLSVRSLHENGIIDVIGSNWISNQILVFSGFGRMKFSDPSVIQCPAEPTAVMPAVLDSDANVDLVAAFGSEHAIRTYGGNGLGEFHLSQTLNFDMAPSGIGIGDINGDGREDIVSLDESGKLLTVLLNDGSGLFGKSIQFGAGAGSTSVTLIRHGTTDFLDAVLLDTVRSRIRILGSARVAAPRSPERILGAGLAPAGVLASPLAPHGPQDILVANSGSRSISLFANDGKGRFPGQIAFAVPSEPRWLSCLAVNESLAVILSTAPGSGKICVLEINPRTYSQAVYTLPVQGEAEILSTRIDWASHFLHIYSFEHDSASHSSLIEFEQISASRFIERTVPFQSPSRILSLTMGDFNGDGVPDIAYCAPDTHRHTESLFQLPGLLSGGFRAP